MQLYTRYRPEPPPRTSWRWLIALGLLGLGLCGWLQWEPKKVAAPQELLWERVPGLGRSGDEDRVPVADRAPAERGAAATATPVAAMPDATPVSVARVETPPVAEAMPGKPAGTLYEAQLALAQANICPGALDGIMGSRTRAALRAFQQQAQLPVTGELDGATRDRLRLIGPVYREYVVSAEDVGRLMVVPETWVGKSQMSRLDYQTVLELVAERFRSDTDLIVRINPKLDWSGVRPGVTLLVPAVRRVAVAGRPAFARIQLSQCVLQAFDENIRLVAHYPCSIAREASQRPAGTLHVTRIVRYPDYMFEPSRFRYSAEARGAENRLVIPAGPNNPVGVAWIGLDKPGYGIHGTPYPEQVGRPESLGCFRLANWNAEQLAEIAWAGMPVHIEP